MKKHKRFIILFIIIILALLGYYYIVYFGDDSQKPFFEGAIRIIQVIISIVIAYLLYDRFGTSRKVLDKQNELIIEFIEKYRSLGIYTYIIDNSILKQSYLRPGRKLKTRYEEKFMNRKILFPKGSLGHPKLLELNTILDKPLFPVELKPDLSALKFHSLTAEIDEFDRENYVFFTFEPIDNSNDLNQKNFMYPNDDNTNFEEFIKRIESSITSIENWVNRESSMNIKLNLE
ncbi:hypothetical protein OO010_07485 [Flavobacteriaceae bacterium KMM 6898]|nr:hypothetical protein [Flavobacteriaceae bacterium KMM 6898]